MKVSEMCQQLERQLTELGYANVPDDVIRAMPIRGVTIYTADGQTLSYGDTSPSPRQAPPTAS